MVWEERWHPLRREWVVVSSHRNDRPWLGETVGDARRDAAGVRSRTATSVRGNTRVSGTRNPDYTGVFVFDNDHPCVSPAAPDTALAPPSASIRTGRPTGSRASCASRRATTSRSPSCRTREFVQPARDASATSIASSARAPRGRARADVREQGRGRGREQSASTLPDLRDELRLQDDRDRGAGVGGALGRARTRRCFSDIIAAEEAGWAAHRSSQRRRRAVVRAVLRALSVRDVRRAARDAREHRRSRAPPS